MENHLREPKFFETDVRSTMATNQRQIQGFQEGVKANRQNLLTLQLEFRNTRIAVEGAAKSMADNTVLLKEIRLALQQRFGNGEDSSSTVPKSAPAPVTNQKPMPFIESESILGSAPSHFYSERSNLSQSKGSDLHQSTTDSSSPVMNLSSSAGTLPPSSALGEIVLGRAPTDLAPVKSVSSFTPINASASSIVTPFASPVSAFMSKSVSQQQNSQELVFGPAIDQSQNANYAPNQIHMIDCPVFYGTSGVKEWIFQCEQHFLMKGVPIKARTKYASVYVRGLALEWMGIYMRGRAGFPPWEEFCRDIYLRFDLTSYDKAVVKWKNIFQKGSMAEYHEEFELSNAGVNCEEQISMGMCDGDLKEKFQQVLIMVNPQSHSEAFQAARIREPYLDVTMKKVKAPNIPPWLKNPILSIIDPSNAFKAIPWIQKIPASNTSKQASSTFRKPTKPLQDKKIEGRSPKGLCFWCDEKSVPKHEFSRRSSNHEIRIEKVKDGPEIEVMNQMDSDSQHVKVDHSEPLISIAAMIEESVYQALRAVSRVGKQLITILVDPGSSNNNLVTALAAKLNCTLNESFQVSMANGNQTKRGESSEGFSWSMQRIESKADTLVLPLAVYDLLLCMHWLQNLEQIIRDFESQYMQFQWKCKIFKLDRAPNSDLKWLRCKKMLNVLTKEDASSKSTFYLVKGKQVEVIQISQEDSLLKLEMAPKLNLSNDKMLNVINKEEEWHRNQFFTRVREKITSSAELCPADNKVEQSELQQWLGEFSKVLSEPSSPPPVRGKLVVLIVVDRLNKAVHFIALHLPYTAAEVAQSHCVFKLHAMPKSIVFVCICVFTMQTEAIVCCLDNLSSCICVDQPQNWVHNPYLAEKSDIETVNQALTARKISITQFRKKLEKAPQMMETMVNKLQSVLIFWENKWAYLELDFAHQSNGGQHRTTMFCSCSAEPALRLMTFKFHFSSCAHIHGVFHASCLKNKSIMEEVIPNRPGIAGPFKFLEQIEPVAYKWEFFQLASIDSAGRKWEFLQLICIYYLKKKPESENSTSILHGCLWLFRICSCRKDCNWAVTT